MREVTQEQIDKAIGAIRGSTKSFLEPTREKVYKIESAGEDVLDTGMTFKGVHLSYVAEADGYPYGKWLQAEEQSTKHKPIYHS